jgi:two-component SAPR family response regulator/tetratricopeptide (TPR) repeat protein
MNKEPLNESTDAWASLPETEARVDAMLEWVENNYAITSRDGEVCAEAETLAERLGYHIGFARAQCLKSIFLCRQFQHDEAIRCAEFALSVLAEKDALHTSISYSVLGRIAVDRGELEKALTHFNQALSYAEKTGSIRWMTTALNGIGVINFRLGNSEQAMACFERNIAMVEKQKYPVILNEAYFNLAAVYHELGDYPRALDYFFLSLNIVEDLLRGRWRGSLLSRIATVYYNLNDAANALSYSLEALAEYELHQIKRDIAKTLSLVGDSYTMMNDFLSATRYLLRAQNLSESLNYPQGKMSALRGLAGLAHATGDTDQAIPLFTSALELAMQVQDPSEIAEIHESLAEVWQKKGNVETAIHHAHEAMTIHTKSHARQKIIKICQQLAELYRLSGNSEQAKIHEEKWRAIEKEIQEEGEKPSLTEKLTTFEVEKAKKEARQYGMSETQIEFAGESIRRAAEERFKHLEQSEKETDTRQKIYVQTFGTFSVVIGGTEIPHNAWQRKKSRDIFKYLLIHYKKTITTDELADAIWHESAASVETSIQNAVSALRKALEQPATAKQAEFIITGNKSYRLDFGDAMLVVDFHEVKRLYREAQSKSEKEKETLYERALRFYVGNRDGGEFLAENLYDEWSAFEREALKDTAIEMAIWLSQHYALANNLTAAVDAAEKVLSLDATNEKAWQIILSSHKARGEKAELQKQYKRCEHVFKKELGTPPPKSLQTLTSVRMKK